MNLLRPVRCFPLGLALWFALAGTTAGAPPRPLRPPGFRPLPPGVHALTGAKVVVQPGHSIENATVVVRDGYIEAVGTNVAAPPDARVWDMSGLTIYAGFIEPYWLPGATNPPVNTDETEPVASRALTAGTQFFGAPGQRTDPGRPGPGYPVGKVVPETRAVRGYSPDKKALESLRALGFAAAVIAPRSGIVRGTSALVALTEADPNQLVIQPDVFQHVAFETERDYDRAESYPNSLMGAIAVLRQSILDARHYALDLADWKKNPRGRPRPDFDPSLEALAPAAERNMRVMFEPGSALMVDRAARLARELELDFAIVSCGEEWRRPDLARETDATFIVPLHFPSLPKWPGDEDWEQATLDQLRAWDWAPENPALLRQQGLEIALTTHGLKDKKQFRKHLRLALDRGLSEDDALAALTTVPARLCRVESLLGTVEPGKVANLTVVDGAGYFDPETKVRMVWVDGQPHFVEPTDAPTKPTSDPDAASSRKKKRSELRDVQRQRVARSPLDGRGPLLAPAAVLVQHATVWTCGPAGVLEDASLLVLSNRIAQVGHFAEALVPPEALRIEAAGQHVTPGLIDCHSHTAILGAVNESATPSSAMCRIGDVVNSETRNLAEQLAGGLTVANLLHGSANPIGGQNQVIKLRDGASPEGLKFEGAPPGIKFALGENVKQSNWGEQFTTRYPQTRMGVPAFYENRFTAAQQYLEAWEAYRHRASNGQQTVPPRRDLELEALAEILQGKRLIHCHSYRQDEILAFLRVMERFGVRVGTLQHVLEGYKIADEIAAHGAGASCFADWWAYKFEVYDAIPHAGSLMRERGVLVSFNSDSSDLARRMNTEAAKAVKFGGTPEIEALRFVTINPARQLRIDDRVGSLEPGKDADFVIWSGPPLDSRSVVLQTWIDGKKYFDRDEAARRAEALQAEREALIAKAKRVAKLAGGEATAAADDDSFFRVALEHQHDGRERGCLDEDDHR